MQRTEVAPGVHRLDWAIGGKPMASYVLAGDYLILVDTGLPSTPEEIYRPAVTDIGRQPEEVRLVVITHADADHIGGNAAVRRVFPHALLACHALDQRWCADPAVITAERYDGFTPYGLRYDQAVFDLLGSWMGPPEPLDLLLQEGVRIRLRDAEWLEVRHVPGHTPGHLLLHNPTARYALIGDAIFGESQLTTTGDKAAAPPYTDVAAYRASVGTIAGLDVALLLTCHYPVMRGAEVGRFIDASLAWSGRAEEVTERLLREAGGPLTLAAAIDAANAPLGPFNDPGELRWAMLAHLQDAVRRGTARPVEQGGVIAWEAVAG